MWHPDRRGQDSSKSTYSRFAERERVINHLDVQICNAQTIFTNGKNKENAYINSNIQIFKLSIKPKIENLYFTQVRKSLSLNRFMIIILFILSIASVDREDDGTGYPIRTSTWQGIFCNLDIIGKEGRGDKVGKYLLDTMRLWSHEGKFTLNILFF